MENHPNITTEPEEQKALISGVYFIMYKRVLRTVLPIVAVVLSVLSTIGFLISSDEPSFHLVIGFTVATYVAHIVGIIATTIGGVIQAFAIITIIFAILEYKKVNLNENGIEALPEVSESKSTISASDAGFGIVFSIAITTLLLGFPQIISGRFDGEWVPIFDVQVIRSLWFPILLWAVIEIVMEIMKLVEGRYTMRLAAIALVTAFLQVVCIIAVFGDGSIVNPDFMYHINNMGYPFEFEAAFGIINIAQPRVIAMAVMFIILFFETLDVVVKAFLYKNATAENKL
jgi:hypothetical protein